MKEKELFVIKDYDTGEVIDVLVTDYAVRCEAIMKMFEAKKMEDSTLDYPDFFDMLDEAGIKYEIANQIRYYRY